MDILDILYNKIENLKKESSPTLDEANFFEKYCDIVFYLDSISSEYIDNISIDHLFILCHRAYYTDEDFITFKNKIESHKKEIAKIIAGSHTNIVPNDYSNLDMTINFKCTLALNLIKDTIFDNEAYQKTLERTLSILYITKNYKSVDNFSNFFKHFFSYCMLEEKKLNSVAYDFKKMFLKKLGLIDIKANMRNRYEEVVKIHNKFIANKKSNYHKYSFLIKSLKNVQNLPYILDSDLIKNLDDELIFEIYKHIITINQDYCKTLFKEKEKVEEISFKSKILSLKKCGYEIDKISKEKLNFILNYGNISELEKIVPFIKNLNYQLLNLYSNNGIYIIVNTTYEILNQINNLIIDNIINLNFVKQNPQIFFNNDIIGKVNGVNNILCNNLDILTKNYELKNSNLNEILLLDNTKLSNNINTLKKYHPNLDNNILLNNDLFDYLDLFIELGLAHYIINGQYKIDDDSLNLIKRIYINKLINFQHPDLENMIKTGVNFYITDDQLDDYIINDVNNYLPTEIKKILSSNDRNIIEYFDLSELENYRKDDLTYDFNGILISKNKILRNLSCLEANFKTDNINDKLFISIIYGSILNTEQIEKIKNMICCKKYTKKIDN